MSKTLRRKPWHPKQKDLPPKQRWRKIANDKTCRPGCFVCGHDKKLNRLDKHREKRLAMQIGEEQLEHAIPVPQFDENPYMLFPDYENDDFSVYSIVEAAAESKNHMRRFSRWW